ncbi:MAG: Tol-Pal system beta propeller repeat protein TolB [Gammaproteobacteria bacterium]|nr:Tol-Pal system beta propeller repeat protein TolB [Gammaproteobacteria bacterium]NNC67454.1 Tol-Pal system beta propeller repeat protein TolB [Gammaproteobacteria bacterium]
MKTLVRVFALSVFLFIWQSAHAVLEIEITQGVEGALPIAIAVFAGETYTAPEAIETIVRNDLARSGFFDVLDKQRFPQVVVNPSQLDFKAWRDTGVESLLLGKITQAGGDQYRIEFQLIDLIRKKRLLGNVIPAGTKDVRKVGHKISDLVFESLTGIRGAFSTRVAYVSTINRGGIKKYVLQIADADGYNARTIFSSSKQILSPAWSPDGSRLAYVSFESDNSAIYVQDIIQGTRAKVSAKSGINSAPSWSPDGRRLALTLSAGGSPDIYILDLGAKNLKRLTSGSAIDTEPSWMPDGKTLLFTSDRSGGPQIYQVSVNGGKAQRLTFDGKYNAAADISPDGRFIALVNNSGNGFRIAIMDMQSKAMRVISNGNLDEGPSFAPNGSMIMYATADQGRGVLAAVSADGRVKQKLRLTEGDVREPSWSPFR